MFTKLLIFLLELLVISAGINLNNLYKTSKYLGILEYIIISNSSMRAPEKFGCTKF